MSPDPSEETDLPKENRKHKSLIRLAPAGGKTRLAVQDSPIFSREETEKIIENNVRCLESASKGQQGYKLMGTSWNRKQPKTPDCLMRHLDISLTKFEEERSKRFERVLIKIGPVLEALKSKDHRAPPRNAA